MNIPHIGWVCLVLLSLLSPAWAGDGHAHDDEPAVQAVQSTPRFSAESEHLEMVGLLRGTRLTLYLDQRSDNQPVAQAQLLLQVDGQSVEVHEHQAGVYEAKVPEAAEHEQQFRVQVSHDAGQEVLMAELHVSHAADEHASEPHGSMLWVWLLLAFLLLVLAGLVRVFGRAKQGAQQ